MLLNDSNDAAGTLRHRPTKFRKGSPLWAFLIPLGIAAGLMLTASCAQPRQAGHADLPTPPQISRLQIERAIDGAEKYLYSKQHDGHWDAGSSVPPDMPYFGPNSLAGGNTGGLTALAVHALLAAGENSNDPRLRPAVDAILREPMRMNPYALCQRDQVLRLLQAHPVQRATAFQDTQYLLRAMRTTGDAAGLYWYDPGPGHEYDHSVSYGALLAMCADSKVGIEVPNNYWETTERAWKHHQYPNGGWSYIYNGVGGTGVPTASMTAAGVSALFITGDFIHSFDGLDCHGNVVYPAIDHGIQWLSENFPSVFTTTPSGACSDTTYSLYCVELVGLAGGYKYFGKHDWYQEGADWLVKHQNADGSWGNARSFIDHNAGNIPATSFALLFLSRGLEPVAFKKVAYDVITDGKCVEGRWNERPRDVAKVTRWIEKQTELNLNWQMVNLKDASLDELEESPILYLSGDRPLDLAPNDEAKLRQFAEDGGLIMGNPDGNAKVFGKSFQQLGSRLFPQYEMRVLPEDHPIYSHEMYRSHDIHHKSLMGLSNGVRELMVLPNDDYGKAWQGDFFASQDDFRLASNLYLYAAGHAKFGYGITHTVHADPAIKSIAAIKLARLDYGGNADPEPGGWRRITAILHNQRRIELNVQTVTLGDGTLATGGYRMAHLTGTGVIQLSPAQRADIAQFINGGGVLFVDAAGGSPAFAASVTAELQNLFPAGAAQLAVPIPGNDPFFTASFPFKWEYRRYTRIMNPRPVGPNLHGMQIDGKWALILSPTDISNALVGRDVDGVNGCTVETATDLAVDLVQYLARP